MKAYIRQIFLSGVALLLGCVPLTQAQSPPETPLVLYGRVNSTNNGGLITEGEVTVTVTDSSKGTVTPITVPVGNIANRYSYRVNVPFSSEPMAGFASPNVSYSVQATYRLGVESSTPTIPIGVMAEPGLLMELTGLESDQPGDLFVDLPDLFQPLGRRPDGVVNQYDILGLIEDYKDDLTGDNKDTISDLILRATNLWLVTVAASQ